MIQTLPLSEELLLQSCELSVKDSNLHKGNTSNNINIHNMDIQTTQPKKTLPPAKYSIVNSGPFLVHLYSTDKNIGHLHPVKLGKLLFENKISNIEIIKKLGMNKLEIQFRTYADANSFLENPLLQSHNLKAFIPFSKVYISGVIKDVDTDITDDEILSYSTAAVKIMHVHRFSRRTESNGTIQYIPTKTVKITFQAEHLPQYVYLYSVRFPVDKYQLPVLQCNNCWMFGHKGTLCRRNAICKTCSEEHPSSECDKPTPKCVNCKLSHPANSTQCTVYQSQKRINKVRSDRNISYQEAKQTLEDLTQYSKIVVPIDLNQKQQTGKRNSLEMNGTQLVSQTSTIHTFPQQGKKTKLTPKIQPNFNREEHDKLLIFPHGRPINLEHHTPIYSQLTACKQGSSFGITNNTNDKPQCFNSQSESVTLSTKNCTAYVKDQIDQIIKNPTLTEDIRIQLRKLEKEIIPLIKL